MNTQLSAKNESVLFICALLRFEEGGTHVTSLCAARTNQDLANLNQNLMADVRLFALQQVNQSLIKPQPHSPYEVDLVWSFFFPFWSSHSNMYKCQIKHFASAEHH